MDIRTSWNMNVWERWDYFIWYLTSKSRWRDDGHGRAISDLLQVDKRDLPYTYKQREDASTWMLLHLKKLKNRENMNFKNIKPQSRTKAVDQKTKIPRLRAPINASCIHIYIEREILRWSLLFGLESQFILPM